MLAGSSVSLEWEIIFMRDSVKRPGILLVNPLVVQVTQELIDQSSVVDGIEMVQYQVAECDVLTFNADPDVRINDLGLHLIQCCSDSDLPSVEDQYITVNSVDLETIRNLDVV